ICGHTRQGVIVKRGQAGEDRPGVRRQGGGRSVQAWKRRHMFNAPRPQDDFDGSFDDLFRPGQTGAGWELNDGDEIALVLLWNETGWRARELHARETDQAEIDEEDDG